MTDRILILDYGSQFTQLIARRVREAHVYSEIHPASRSLAWIREFAPKGIILSGGPNSVYDEGAPLAEPGLLQLGVPVLGLCYGMQLMAHLAGARVVSAARREYGRAAVAVGGGRLFQSFTPGEEIQVWMSHGDHVDAPPEGFVATASSPNSPVAGLSTAPCRSSRCSSTPRSPTPRGAARSSPLSCSTSAAARPTGLPATSSKAKWRRSSARSVRPPG